MEKRSSSSPNEFRDAWRPRWRSSALCRILSSSCVRPSSALLPRRPAALVLHAGVREAERKEGTGCLAFGLALPRADLSRRSISQLFRTIRGMPTSGRRKEMFRRVLIPGFAYRNI